MLSTLPFSHNANNSFFNQHQKTMTFKISKNIIANFLLHYPKTWLGEKKILKVTIQEYAIHLNLEL